MNIEVIRYRLPVYWACALINGDYTGLSDEEEREINNFLEQAEGYPVDVDLETEGFVYSVRTTGRFVTDNVDLIQRTRVELAQNELETFVSNMLNLGFEESELVAQLEGFLKGDSYGHAV